MRRLGALVEAGALEREIVRLRRKDGTVFSGSIWAVAVHNDQGKVQYFDGIVEDVTDLVARDEERERLLSETQAALFFFGQSLDTLPQGGVVTCDAHTSVQAASRLMAENNRDCAVVLDDNRPAGIITSRDLCALMADTNTDLERPVAQIMSSPVITAERTARIFEVGLLMEQHAISHVPVVDEQGKIIGMVTHAMITPLAEILSLGALAPHTAGRKTRGNFWAAYDPVFLITNLIQSGAGRNMSII